MSVVNDLIKSARQAIQQLHDRGAVAAADDCDDELRAIIANSNHGTDARVMLLRALIGDVRRKIK